MRGRVLVGSLTLTFIMMRVYLHASPNTDLNIAGYNIHHLFTGLMLVTLGGVPAVLLPHASPWSLPAVAVFGVGLALALDEWVYLIVTDGTNASYVLPVSLWGGAVAVSAAVVYALIVSRQAMSRK